MTDQSVIHYANCYYLDPIVHLHWNSFCLHTVHKNVYTSLFILNQKFTDPYKYKGYSTWKVNMKVKVTAGDTDHTIIRHEN